MTESQYFTLLFLFLANSQLKQDLNDQLRQTAATPGSDAARVAQFKQAFQAKLTGAPFNIHPAGVQWDRFEPLFTDGNTLHPTLDTSPRSLSAAFSQFLIYSPGPCPRGQLVGAGPETDVQARLWHKFTA